MKQLLTTFVLVLVMSCGPNPSEQLKHLNGYWEIVEVKTKDGQSKAYNYNTIVDYIFISDFKGFRKKMQPGINNQYKTSDDAEALEAKIENNRLTLYYTTALDQWKETVITVNENELEIINEEELTYIYKRYEPVNLELD